MASTRPRAGGDRRRAGAGRAPPRWPREPAPREDLPVGRSRSEALGSYSSVLSGLSSSGYPGRHRAVRVLLRLRAGLAGCRASWRGLELDEDLGLHYVVLKAHERTLPATALTHNYVRESFHRGLYNSNKMGPFLRVPLGCWLERARYTPAPSDAARLSACIGLGSNSSGPPASSFTHRLLHRTPSIALNWNSSVFSFPDRLLPSHCIWSDGNII